MVGDRHDLVVVAVHHERRHADALEILGEVGLREGLDSVVVRLGAARHGLPPPILNDARYWLRARPVEAVERTAREIEIELRAVASEGRAQAVEHFDRQAAWTG